MRSYTQELEEALNATKMRTAELEKTQRQRRITRLARIAQAKLECKTGQVGLIRIDRPPEADCQCESFSRRC